MLSAELHLHTKEDKFDEIRYSAKELIDHLSKLGREVIAITCHDTLVYSDKLKRYAESKNILLIPGCEIWIEKKHVVVLNWIGDPFQIKTFEDLKKLKRENKEAIVLAAHPFFSRRDCLKEDLEKNIDLFDAIEYCHLYNDIINLNKKAVQIAKKYNKPLIGTSDAHHLFQINHTYTKINSKKNIPSIIKALKEKKIELVTKPLPLFKFITILFLALFDKFIHPIKYIKSFKYVHFDKKY